MNHGSTAGEPSNGRRAVTWRSLVLLAGAHASGWAACWQLHDRMEVGDPAAERRKITPDDAAAFWNLQTVEFRAAADGRVRILERIDQAAQREQERLARIEALLESIRERLPPR